MLAKAVVMKHTAGGASEEDAQELVTSFKNDDGSYKPGLFGDLSRDEIQRSQATNKLLLGFLFVHKFDKYPAGGRHGLSGLSKPTLITRTLEIINDGQEPKLPIAVILSEEEGDNDADSDDRNDDNNNE